MLKIWDTARRSEIGTYTLESPSLPLVCFSPDQKRLAIQLRLCGAKKPFRLIDTSRKQELHRFSFGNGGRAMAFLPGGKKLLYLGAEAYIPAT